ncbi:MAG TPA: tetratricopeptide repeat protein [Bryobacteraceae bacterium]|nr:tetratricopeptide repeat protein [Bryobacteraceae bacterium]
MPATPTQAYTREEVRRLLDLTERQLKSWERQSFIPVLETFTFSDLLALKTLIALRKANIAAIRIRRALQSLREKLREIENPLTELKLYSDGGRIQVQFGGHHMEPITGQLLLNFDQAELARLLSFPEKKAQQENTPAKAVSRRVEAERWFEKGLELEQTGAPLEDVIKAYQQALVIDPSSAGALVNLGTVYFNARAWREAERYYNEALKVDPDYSLAHFNLGNLCDETGDRTGALEHYQAALRANASYADAHYNIALLYQSIGQPLNAVRHWKAYLKLDPGSSWAAIARRELAKLRDSTVVSGARADHAGNGQ